MKSLTEKQFFESLSAKARVLRVPEAVTFELTYGCNLRCVHCYNPTHRALPQELTTEEVCSILDQCAKLGVATLCCSGGELFVRPDVFAIFAHAKSLGFLLELNTNATRITSAIADRLQDPVFRSVAVSIYGATKRTYEQITLIPGSYDQFRRGLACLAARRIPVIVRMPVMTENADEIRDAKTLVEGLGFKFQYCLDINPKSDGDTGPLAYRLSPPDKVHINQVMLGYRYEPVPTETCAANQDFISCECGRSRFAITPYGEMNLCVSFPTPRYDLRTGTVKEGWETLKQTVDRARPNANYACPTCDVRSCCSQGQSDAWLETGDMSSCLPHFKEWAQLEYHTHALLDPRRPR